MKLRQRIVFLVLGFMFMVMTFLTYNAPTLLEDRLDGYGTRMTLGGVDEDEADSFPGATCLRRLLENLQIDSASGRRSNNNTNNNNNNNSRSSQKQPRELDSNSKSDSDSGSDTVMRFAVADLWDHVVRDKVLGDDHNIEALVKLTHLFHDYIRTNRTRKAVEEEATETDRDTYDVELQPQVIATLQKIAAVLAANRTSRLKDNIDSETYNDEERLCYHRPAFNGSEEDLPNWKRWQNHITRTRLYSEDDPAVRGVLEDMATLPIRGVQTLPDSGTQLKLIFMLSDGSRALFKPQRKPIDEEVSADVFYFDEFERFNAEVAAFQLDRILQFYRVPPSTSRMVNLTYDIQRHFDGSHKKKFYVSPVGNTCFYGKCDQFCDSPFAVCGSPDMIAGSLAVYLPTRSLYPRSAWENPYAQSYYLRKRAEWMKDETFCDSLRVSPPYDTGRRLLDIMDMAVFDFIMGNRDRHHYGTFEAFDNETSFILFDNGRGFGRWTDEYLDLMAPIYQCCLFRLSTLERLLELETGPRRLSDLLREALIREAVQPLLTDGHYTALDRRLKLVLQQVYECVQRNDGYYSDVVLDDGL